MNSLTCLMSGFFFNIILIILFVLFIFTAMIDSIGGPVKVNNMLSTLNIPPIGEKNLKCMERRAGEVVEKVAGMSTLNAAKEAFEMEMQ